MISDDKHNYLKCIDCKRELADVVITRECDDIKFNYVALCPYCGSQSNTENIKGLVHIGSIPKSTLLKNFDTQSDKVVILLAKES